MRSVTALFLLLTAALAAAAPGPQFTLKVGVDLVNVLFTVTDRRGRLVPGLGPEDFIVDEDGKRQEILHFARENELPLTIALLIDTSPSVRPIFDEERVTAVQFLRSILRPKDLALVIGFDRSVTLVQDYTESGDLLEQSIATLSIGSGTSLFDAIYLACQEKLKSEAGRKAIILISDGEDTTSKLKSHEALFSAHESNTVIYSISNVAGGFFGRGGFGDPGTLKKFSEETGGVAFFPKGTRELKEVFDRIAEELRSQYSLGYVSTNTAKDGKYRQIRIVSRNRDLRVRARKGYYAPKSAESQ